MNTGQGATWQRLSKPNNDLSDTILVQEKLNDQKKKEDQARLDLENKKKERALNKKASELKGINSGKSTKYLHFEHSLNDAFRKEGGLIDKYAEAQETLESDPGNTNAIAIKTNIEQQVQRIAGIKNAILGYNKKLAEGIASGKISKKLNEGYLTNMDRINNGEVEFEIGDYGNVRILNKGNVDLDGDGLPDELSLESLSDINNFGVWEADFNLNNFNTELKKQFAEKHTKNDDGTFTTKEKLGYNLSHTEDVKNKYREVLGTDVNSLTNQGKSFLYQKGYTPRQVQENPEIYEGIIGELEQDFRNLYKSKDFETTNHSAKNARSKNSLAWTKYNKKDKPSNSLKTTVDGILVGDDTYLKSLENQKLEEQGSDGKDVYIREVDYSDGKIVLRLNDQNLKVIDTADKKSAVAKILKMIRPNDDPDSREEEYRKGVSEVEYKKNEKKGITKLEISNKLGKTSKSGELTKKLAKLGIINVKDLGGWFKNNISINGKKFENVDTEDGMNSLKEYIENHWEALTTQKKDDEEKKDVKSKQQSFNKTHLPEGGF
ncbi:hypothetical protein [Tenacibaculum sp. C7A-26P2]|uniref:hypothetical protein n=1 Tax=Tenacibaculum sp. C7A-26P2 TaxID=3447504 RepID=UPI003F865A48